METFRRGNALYLSVSVKNGTDKDFPLVSPSGGVKCWVYRPDGTLAVNNVAMTEAETGIYSLTQQTDGTWQLGTYRVKVESTNSGLTNFDVSYFQLVLETP